MPKFLIPVELQDEDELAAMLEVVAMQLHEAYLLREDLTVFNLGWTVTYNDRVVVVSSKTHVGIVTTVYDGNTGNCEHANA